MPVDRVQEAEAKAVKYYAQRARLPGFRQGKAPEAVVRKRFGDAIRQSVLEEVIRESWETAKSNESLKPITDPSIRNLKFEVGSPIEFDLLVEVRPEITLGRMGGFRVERTLPAVTDSAVDEQLARLQEQKAAWIPVEGEKPSPGQMVRVEVAPIEDEKVGASQPYDLVLGQNQAIPDLEERIMTLLPGESADAEVKFPDDHPDESRRGQARRVRVTLHDVKRQELPPLDDAFAREVGDFEGLDALRAAVRHDLEREAAREADAQRAPGAPRPDHRGQRHPGPRVAGAPADARLRRDVPRSPGAAGAVRAAVSSGGGGAGAPRPGARRGGRVATVSAPPSRSSTSGSARWPRRAACRPPSSTASLQKANRLPELERSITEEKAFAFLMQQSTVDEAQS